MNLTIADRFKNHLYTALINFTEAPVIREQTPAEHDRQRDMVRASQALSEDRTERHAMYAVRPGSGWRHGQVTPPRPTEPRP